MSTPHKLSIPVKECDATKLSHFRFGAFNDGVILTTDHGAWHWLTENDFSDFLAGRLVEDSADYKALCEKGFVRAHTNLEEWGQAVQRRKNFLGIGPVLHQIQLQQGQHAMAIDTAKAIVDHALQSTSAVLNMELIQQHGPLNEDLVQFIVSYANEKNRYENKEITWIADISMADLTASAAQLLVDSQIAVRAVVDLASTTSQAKPNGFLSGIERLNDAARENDQNRVDFHGVLPLSKAHLGQAEAMLAQLIDLGLNTVFIEPILVGDNSLTPDEFKGFYRQFMALLLAENAGLKEGYAHAIASTVLREDAPIDPRYRSPGGAGLCCHAYDALGGIYPNTDAIALAEPHMFQIGSAGRTTYDDTLLHPTLKTLAMASILDCLPGFSTHWSTPFLTVDPIACYASTGNVFESLPTSPRVRIALSRIEVIFEWLISEDTANKTTLETWLAG